MSRPPSFTVDQLRSWIRYDPKTGLCFWVDPPSRNQHAGRIAGKLKPLRQNRWQIQLLGRWYMLSNIIWYYVTGEWPIAEIDHKDRNAANNVWTNLRPASSSENKCNRGVPRNNTSGISGVSYRGQNRGHKWEVNINLNGRRIYLGRFTNKDEAIAVRKAAELKYFGAFAP